MSSILDFLSSEMLSDLILAPHLSEAKELGRISLVCSQFHRAAQEDALWYQAAKNRYGCAITTLTKKHVGGDDEQSYQNWKQVLKDDNSQVAMPTLKMRPKPCFWKYNDGGAPPGANLPDMFYCCVIVGIKWFRSTNRLAIFIDARGEPDLRRPRPCIECSAWCKSLSTGSWLSSFNKKKPGHYKGCLLFDARWFEKPGTYRFCYNDEYNDYGYTELFTIPELEHVQGPNERRYNDPSYQYPYLNHLFGLKQMGPKYTPRYTENVLEPQTKEEERVMFQEFVPEKYLNRSSDPW